VREAQKNAIKVVPIPGASALISSLSAAGIASDKFGFFGFLPSKQTARIRAIQAVAHLEQSVIFYESPKRILACAKDLLSILGSTRLVCFAKELTKTFESIQTSTLPNVIAHLEADPVHQKGEFVILIARTEIQKNEALLDKVLPILLKEMGASKAAKLAAKITGIDKKYCYQRAI
jgi:16S rRNA (cytidine1402-2'-O)-methyltransferase